MEAEISKVTSEMFYSLDWQTKIWEVKHRWKRTTEVFKLDITGLWTAMHLLDDCLQADISDNTSLGSVATLTSDSPFAHADEPTNHKNEKTTVTMKSYRNKQKDKTVKEMWILDTNHLVYTTICQLENSKSI